MDLKNIDLKDIKVSDLTAKLKTVDKKYKIIKHDHFILYFLSKKLLIYHVQPPHINPDLF